MRPEETTSIPAIRAAYRRLFELLDDMNEATAGQKPAGGAWSVMDCLEHVFMVNRSITALLTAAGAPGAEEDPDFEVMGQSAIEKAMANRKQKYEAPAPFKPRASFASLQEASYRLTKQSDQLVDALQAGRVVFDDRVTPHPYLGEMSQRDWIYFVIAHTHRHADQIEEIKARLSSGKAG